jgi:hypothetical protein
LDRAGDRAGGGAGGEFARRGDVADQRGLDQQQPDAQADDRADLLAGDGADAEADGGEQRSCDGAPCQQLEVVAGG